MYQIFYIFQFTYTNFFFFLNVNPQLDYSRSYPAGGVINILERASKLDQINEFGDGLGLEPMPYCLPVEGTTTLYSYCCLHVGALERLL